MSKSREGWLKIKLSTQSKWHRRYCTIDWDKSVFFLASRPDTRYREWIKLLPNVIINEHESSSHNESNSNSLLISINEVKDKGVTVTHLVQTETKTDYDRWLLALKQAAYSRSGGGIFGQSLEDTYRYSQDKTSSVPVLVRQCCEYLLEHGSTFVGLFRVPGKQTSIKELRDLYDRGAPVQLKESDSPATVASLLKIYLQSLPESIIPTRHFDDFLEIGSRFKYNQTNDLSALKQLIEGRLSNIHYAVLAYLCLFLRRITEHAHVTKMDADNLAVVFGSNLIRPVEELDLNMVRGHNYNLIPLIKVLIDQSEYLFSNNNNNNPSNQFHDSYEQAPESVTKSSGFSSISSLLSTTDHPITTKSRSTSMPSICMETFSSSDSANLSFENYADQRQASTGDEETNLRSDRSRSTGRYVKRSTNDPFQENQQGSRPKRYGSMDLLEAKTNRENVKRDPTPTDSASVQPRARRENKPHPVSTMDLTVPVRKMEKYSPKRGLANRFGKSFSSLRSSMSKALQAHNLPNENEAHPVDSFSSNQSLELKPLEHQLSSPSVKQLCHEIDHLKSLCERKDSIITELRRAAYEERLKFEQDKAQLNQRIEQLRDANMLLKKQLSMQ